MEISMGQITEQVERGNDSVSQTSLTGRVQTLWGEGVQKTKRVARNSAVAGIFLTTVAGLIPNYANAQNQFGNLQIDLRHLYSAQEMTTSEGVKFEYPENFPCGTIISDIGDTTNPNASRSPRGNKHAGGDIPRFQNGIEKGKFAIASMDGWVVYISASPQGKSVVDGQVILYHGEYDTGMPGISAISIYAHLENDGTGLHSSFAYFPLEKYNSWLEKRSIPAAFRVEKGNKLGIIGNTGPDSRGVLKHLHYEVRYTLSGKFKWTISNEQVGEFPRRGFRLEETILANFHDYWGRKPGVPALIPYLTDQGVRVGDWSRAIYPQLCIEHGTIAK